VSRIFCSLVLSLAVLALCLTAPARAQDWSYYSGTQAGTRYSKLDQINRDNVAKLKLAWTYRTGDAERYGDVLLPRQSLENTPILIEGSLIVCSALGRVMALDPETGTQRWEFDPFKYFGAADFSNASFPKCRGVTPWRDSRAPAGAACQIRLIYGNWRFRAYAIDARTGKPCTDFGNGGEVVFDPGRQLDPDEYIVIPAPPAVVGDVVVFGSSISDSIRADSLSGKVRALDARTGAVRWEFDPIPRDPGDPAAASWQGDSAQTSGNANVWTMMAVDEERDLVFLPTTSPSNDFYGGTRPGNNHYADSLVALRGSTGELVWHFQIVHHDIWDYDLPAQPILIDLPRGGVTVPAVVQLTKQGLVFVLNRETGVPVFPVEERPVPQDPVAGEWLSPTQPFPTAPPPLVAQGISPDDAWGFTPLDRWMCRRKIESLRYGPIYTPPSLQGTIFMPSALGGANWGGGAFDPERKLLVVNTQHIASILKLVPSGNKDSNDAGMQTLGEHTDIVTGVGFPQRGSPYAVQFDTLLSPLGVPCTEPPWGRLSAVDLVQGTIRWQVALGSIEKLAPVPLPLAMGTPNLGGAIITAGGVVFIGAALDNKLRAFDIETGAVLWEQKLPAGAQATPMTYSSNGRQYVIICAAGHPILGGEPGDWFLAFAL
jgi:quinoprotein glucose dehydrogenase